MGEDCLLTQHAVVLALQALRQVVVNAGDAGLGIRRFMVEQLGGQVCVLGLLGGTLDVRDVATNNLISEVGSITHSVTFPSRQTYPPFACTELVHEICSDLHKSGSHLCRRCMTLRCSTGNQRAIKPQSVSHSAMHGWVNSQLHNYAGIPAVQAAGMLALLRERCGDELPAYLSAPQGPAAAAASLPTFSADLAARLAPDRPDVKPLKALLQQAVKEARQQVSCVDHHYVEHLVGQHGWSSPCKPGRAAPGKTTSSDASVAMLTLQCCLWRA